MTFTTLNLIISGAGLLLVGLGIPLMLRKVAPNHFYGLRVPETLHDERVWYEANARTGRELSWLGLAIVALPWALSVLPWPYPEAPGVVYALALSVGVIAVGVRGIRLAQELADVEETGQ